MPHRRRYDDSQDYPDDMRRTFLQFLGINRGHVAILCTLLGGGGLLHSHISDGVDRVSIMEKKTDQHAILLSGISDRLSRLETEVADRGNYQTETNKEIKADLRDIKAALERGGVSGGGGGKGGVSLVP